MIDPKFKDMLTLANMGITPDALTAFRNHRNNIQQGDDAAKMRNTFLFGNTFANPSSQTNATFIPPQEGSMYDPQNQRRQVATKLDMAMTNTPDRFINPLLSPDTFARPSGSTLLNNVNANSAPVMFQNLNKEAVADNLKKTIGDVDARENKLAKRKERFDKLRKFGLALQGKDPNEMDMKKVLQQLQIQSTLLNQKNTQSIIQGREDKKTQENQIIDYAKDIIKTDTTIRNKDLYLNNPGLLLKYGEDKLKENPAEVLFNYVQNGQMSVNKFREIQLTSNAELTKLINNSNKYVADTKPEEIIELIKGVSYEDYANNVQGIKDTVNGIIVDKKDLLTDGENTSLQLRKNLDPFFGPLQTPYD
jgi:hypothetical protein|tara:strand:- start:2704 stop:3792 length:1089 start_codon:yes stop_codon:yes gene_type:complete